MCHQRHFKKSIVGERRAANSYLGRFALDLGFKSW
jgi:hypothetical protein